MDAWDMILYGPTCMLFSRAPNVIIGRVRSFTFFMIVMNL